MVGPHTGRVTASPRRVVQPVIVLVAFCVAGVSCGSSGNKRDPDGNAPIKSSRTLATTHGPYGEKATPASALRLSSSQGAKLRRGHYTAALVWHESADFTTAVTAGVRDTLKQLRIKVVAE